MLWQQKVHNNILQIPKIIFNIVYTIITITIILHNIVIVT